jgi:hypothetical protein
VAQQALIFSEACHEHTAFRRRSSPSDQEEVMLNRLSQCLALAAVVAFAVPVFAKRMSQPLEVNQPTQIGSVTLQPGTYRVMADSNSNQVLVKRDRDGKLVATVEGKIVTLPHKSVYGAIVMDGQRVHEIEFAGKTQAIEIPNS